MEEDFYDEMINEYKDKFRIERIKILQEYAEKMKNQQLMYVYDKSKENYLVSSCEKNRSNEIIKINENDLPQYIKIGSIIRKENGKYELDLELSKEIEKILEEKKKKLLEEQKNTMQKRRIEGHIYEFVEPLDKNIMLIDNSENTGEVFEENFYAVFENAKEGELFEFIEGEYKKI